MNIKRIDTRTANQTNNRANPNILSHSDTVFFKGLVDVAYIPAVMGLLLMLKRWVLTFLITTDIFSPLYR